MATSATNRKNIKKNRRAIFEVEATVTSNRAKAYATFHNRESRFDSQELHQQRLWVIDSSLIKIQTYLEIEKQ